MSTFEVNITDDDYTLDVSTSPAITVDVADEAVEVDVISGAQGVQGPQGPEGDAGPQGDAGADAEEIASYAVWYRSLSTDPDWGTYFIGADPTRTNHGDWSVAQIINRRTKEQVGVWRGKIDPASFGEELFKLGLLCNRAEIAVEKQGSGELVVGKLLGMRYPRVWTQSKIDKDPGNESPNIYGWTTNMQSKHSLIGWLIKMMVDRSISIHHKTTFEECNTYVVDENGTYGPNTSDGHDDCVMSLAIAYLCEHMSAPTQPYGSLTSTAERVAALPWADWQDPPST